MNRRKKRKKEISKRKKKGKNKSYIKKWGKILNRTHIEITKEIQNCTLQVLNVIFIKLYHKNLKRIELSIDTLR